VPWIVVTCPADTGPFGALTRVTTGPSYVKLPTLVPICPPRVAETSCDIPLPAGAKQLTVVSVDQDVVRQAVEPILTDGVVSTSVTKLNPERVTLAKPEVAPL